MSGENSVGGLVGDAFVSDITNAFATGAVAASSSSVGGLVGVADGTDIEDSYATGLVTGTGAVDVGGLVGIAIGNATITNAFATGAVTGNLFVGGLLGGSASGTSIANAFATGSVTGMDSIGGLVGQVTGTSSSGNAITNAFAAGVVMGATNVGGFVGQTAGFTYEENHFVSDTIMDAFGDITGDDNVGLEAVTGASLADLQIPTAAGDTAGDLFFEWDETVWDFGTDTQLPGLIIDGEVFRDGDADGVID